METGNNVEVNGNDPYSHGHFWEW